MSTAIGAVSDASILSIVSGASGNMPPIQKMSNLFDAIDTNGAGSINEAQFDQAFQTLNPPAVFQAQGANNIWSTLDPNNTGSVTKQDFVNTMKNLMAELRADSQTPANIVTPAQTVDASLQSLNILV